MKTDPTVAACIIHEKKMLFIHHTKSGLWLFPGGHIEENETPDSAVHREVLEEVGLSISFVHDSTEEKIEGEIMALAQPFYSNLHNVGDHNHYCHYYLCTKKEGIVTTNHESKGHKWLTLEEIKKDQEIIPVIKKIAQQAFNSHSFLK